MTTLNPGSRRPVDGPMRRSNLPHNRPETDAAPPVNPLLTQPIQPEPSRPSVSEPPVFEYRKPRHMRGGSWKWARRVAIVLAIILVVAGAWFAITAFLAARNIITTSRGGAPALAGNVNLTQLKGEGDGRINVLVLGIGGPGHEAPNLSDTILVMSIDPHTKDAAMLSIPRDLYVKLPAVAKYNDQYGKINAANAYGGPEYATKVVEKVIGVPIHYYTQIDFSGFKQAIDAVGGVDVVVPKAIYDGEYPCDNERGGTCPFSVKAGKQHMNGTVALRYARSRKSTSDFDRAARQQIIISALREKSLQVSTLTNPVKLTGLINAVGSHVKTDMQADEITKMATIVKDIDSSKVVTEVLDTAGEDSLLIDGSGRIAGAGSIELPRAGNFDYSEIQDFVKNIFVDHYITDENARIEVQNGSGVAGMAGSVVKSLKAAHYNVGEPLNSAQRLTQTAIYDYTGGKKPYTINYLERRFGVKVVKAASPTPMVDTTTGKPMAVPEIRIILGSNYEPINTSQ